MTFTLMSDNIILKLCTEITHYDYDCMMKYKFALRPICDKAIGLTTNVYIPIKYS